jgi:dTMP kinase
VAAAAAAHAALGGMTRRGRLITFEGGEGAGKSTQIERLAGALRGAGIDVLVTREPGGTPGAEQIRTLLLEGAPERWLPLTEVLLLLAARHDHVVRHIAPALSAGHWVLCDRFIDSTRVYQGMAGAVGEAVIGRLHDVVLGDLRPDLTVVLDVSVALGLGRRRAAAGEHRYEQMTSAFHERVREGFLAVARAEPERCMVIDASRPADAVANDVRALVARRLGLDLGRAAEGS